MKADKEEFLKTAIFMPSDTGCCLKFMALVQPSCFAMICFPSDDGEDFSENYERCPWQLSIYRHSTSVFIVRLFHNLPSSKFTFSCRMVTDSLFSFNGGLVLFHVTDLYR